MRRKRDRAIEEMEAEELQPLEDWNKETEEMLGDLKVERENYLASIASSLEKISKKLDRYLDTTEEKPTADGGLDMQDLQAAIDQILEKLTENLNDIGSSIAAHKMSGMYRSDSSSLLVDFGMMINYIGIAKDEVKKLLEEKNDE